VVKQELLRIPLFGKLIIGSRMFAIDRTAGSAALRARLREGDRAVREARQIVIFPEGTRSEPGSVRSCSQVLPRWPCGQSCRSFRWQPILASAGDGVPSASGRG
jgi:1-acyl-sn-glycerol-3-phosphate acyltransferase